MTPNNNNTPTADWSVIFDVDGTMVNNSRYHKNAWIELGHRHDIGIDEEFYMTHIHSKSNVDIAYTVFADMVGVEKGLALGEEKGAIYREMYRPDVKEMPGFTNLIKQLTAIGVQCAAASNSPKPNIDMVLEELNLAHHFKVIIDNGQVKQGKPDPEMFLTAAKQMNTPPARCIVVEDSISGYLAAEAANMPYIVITAGSYIPDLKKAKKASALHKDFTTVTIEKLKNHLTSQ